MRKNEFSLRVTKEPYKPPDDFLKSYKPDNFLMRGNPISETLRARALNRVHWNNRGIEAYQFANAMTSTQYQRPVTSVYGPMQRERVYGLNMQQNRHGFRHSLDIY